MRQLKNLRRQRQRKSCRVSFFKKCIVRVHLATIHSLIHHRLVSLPSFSAIKQVLNIPVYVSRARDKASLLSRERGVLHSNGSERSSSDGLDMSITLS